MQLRKENVDFSSKNVKKLYNESFPKKERLPFPALVALAKFWNTDFWAFYDEEQFCGFICNARDDNWAYVMFLATDAQLRSKGYGSAILQDTLSCYQGKSVVLSYLTLDSEAADYEERLRRHDFYAANGFKETGYMMEMNGAKLDVVASADCSMEEFEKFFNDYSKGIMKMKLWKK